VFCEPAGERQYGSDGEDDMVMRRDGTVVKKRFVDNDATALLALRRFDVADLRAVLDKPRLSTAPGVRVGVELAAKHLVEQLRLLHGQRKELAMQLRDALAAMPKDNSGKSDADIVKSLPGIGDVTAAALLVEGHQALVHHNLRQLRGLAGVAPVQISTGKKERKKKPLVVMRRASSTRMPAQQVAEP
jgi:transposase